jgi:hypothetical protein
MQKLRAIRDKNDDAEAQLKSGTEDEAGRRGKIPYAATFISQHYLKYPMP